LEACQTTVARHPDVPVVLAVTWAVTSLLGRFQGIVVAVVGVALATVAAVEVPAVPKVRSTGWTRFSELID
jgi:hypothetical protein